jgi:hypothetical protein
VADILMRETQQSAAKQRSRTFRASTWNRSSRCYPTPIGFYMPGSCCDCCL